MLSDNRQDYVVQTNDRKGEEGVGKAMGVVVLFVLFLAFVQVAYESTMAWYRDTLTWLSDTATYLAGFWPF